MHCGIEVSILVRSPNSVPMFKGDWVVLCEVPISVRRSGPMFCLEIFNNNYFDYTFLK